MLPSLSSSPFGSSSSTVPRISLILSLLAAVSLVCQENKFQCLKKKSGNIPSNTRDGSIAGETIDGELTPEVPDDHVMARAHVSKF